MHAKVLHPDPLNRPYASTGEAADDIMTMIVDFANEAIGAWVEVANQPIMAAYRDEMVTALRSAVEKADQAARSLGIEPLFASAPRTEKVLAVGTTRFVEPPPFRPRSRQSCFAHDWLTGEHIPFGV